MDNQTLENDPIYQKMKKLAGNDPGIMGEMGTRINTTQLANLFLHLGLSPKDFYDFAMSSEKTVKFMYEAALFATVDKQRMDNNELPKV